MVAADFAVSAGFAVAVVAADFAVSAGFVVVAAGFADSAGFAVVAAGFAVSAGFAVVVAVAGLAAADRTVAAAKSRRKQICFIVMYREKEFVPRRKIRGRERQINIDWKRENANVKVKTRAKKVQKKDKSV